MGTFTELPFYALMTTQLLHGCTFAAVHLGTVGFLGIATPPTLRSSAQAIYTALSDGGFMCMATMMAAKLYSAYNNQVAPSHTHARPSQRPAPRLVGPPDHCLRTKLLWLRVACSHTPSTPTSTAQTAARPFIRACPLGHRPQLLTNCARDPTWAQHGTHEHHGCERLVVGTVGTRVWRVLQAFLFSMMMSAAGTVGALTLHRVWDGKKVQLQ